LKRKRKKIWCAIALAHGDTLNGGYVAIIDQLMTARGGKNIFKTREKRALNFDAGYISMRPQQFLEEKRKR